jgi:hypothetical protein
MTTTLRPTDYRAWRTEAAGRDRAYADAYRAGLADGRRHRERLVVIGIVAAVLVFGRRLGLHPLLGLAVAAAAVVSLWPVLLAVLVAELTVRQHRRHGSWPRTAAYVAAWLVGIALVVGAVAWRSSWPLVAVVALLVAWTTGPSLDAWSRRHRGRGPGKGNGTGGGVDPSWPPPFTDADETLGARTGTRQGTAPYRVVYTAKAQHLETRRYADGRTVTIDTLTGETIPDPLVERISGT